MNNAAVQPWRRLDDMRLDDMRRFLWGEMIRSAEGDGLRKP
jgi:hypothetical protein